MNVNKRKAYATAAALFIFVVTFFVFFQVTVSDFVMWDDDWLLYENPHVGGINFENLYKILVNVNASSSWYTPLTGLRWCVTYHFCGLNPIGYHLGDLLIHSANAVLLFFLLCILIEKGCLYSGINYIDQRLVIISSIIASLFWALHPLRVETVAWAAAGAYEQAFFFLLLSLIFYLYSNKEDNSTACYLFFVSTSVICYFFSMLSQPVGMFFLVVYLIMDVYPLKKITFNNKRIPELSRHIVYEKIAFVTVFIIIVAVTAYLHFSGHKGGHHTATIAEFSVIQRIMQAFYIWAYYAWRLWYPVELAPVYSTLISFDPVSFPFIASFAAVIIVSTLIIICLRKIPIAGALLIFHLVLLIPNLGLLEYPHYPVDRYSMIVSAGWSVFIAAVLNWSKIRMKLRIMLLIFLIGLTALFGALSFRQSLVWKNSITLFEHIITTLGDDPYKKDIFWRLGIVYMKQNNIREAKINFRNTLKINPYHQIANFNFARILYGEGNHSEAAKYFIEVIRKNPDHLQARFFLGNIRAEQGRVNEAVEHFSRVVQLDPHLAAVHNNLGCVLSEIGRIDEAEYYFRQAIKLKPDYNNARTNLSILLKEYNGHDQK